MNYYVQGDAANADKIKAAFEAKGITTGLYDFHLNSSLYFSAENKIKYCDKDGYLARIIKTHPDYKELELPIKPKFKAEDRIVSKSDKSTIYRIITLHEERREYIVEIEHKDYHESCPWIAFEDQDDYELVPKPHYDIANFKVGMPVLTRDEDDERWTYMLFSHSYVGSDGKTCFIAGGWIWSQCIPFEGNEELLGTTDSCDEEYINW